MQGGVLLAAYRSGVVLFGLGVKTLMTLNHDIEYQNLLSV